MPDLNVDALVASAKHRLDGALGAGAGLMMTKLFNVLGVQAPLLVGAGGRIFAAERATPGAPPRRVTGVLQAHVGLDRVGEADWVFGVRAGVPYARQLETDLGHAFFGLTVRDNLDELTRVVADHFRGGG